MGNNSDTRMETKLNNNLLVGFENVLILSIQKSLTLCYANCILQVMLHHPVFIDIIQNSEYKQ